MLVITGIKLVSMKIGPLLFLIIFLAGCETFTPAIPPNGKYSVSNLQETDTPYIKTITDTLTFCQKNTILQLNQQTQTYRQILPDTACPLVQPFKDSGLWQVNSYGDGGMVDSVPFGLIDSSKDKFALYFGVIRNGSRVSIMETFQRQ
jgi:hypothetical protein